MQICIAKADGSGRRVVTATGGPYGNGTGYSDTVPAFSTDGRYIVFDSNRQTGTVGESHLFRVDLTSGSIVQVTFFNGASANCGLSVA